MSADSRDLWTKLGIVAGLVAAVGGLITAMNEWRGRASTGAATAMSFSCHTDDGQDFSLGLDGKVYAASGDKVIGLVRESVARACLMDVTVASLKAHYCVASSGSLLAYAGGLPAAPAVGNCRQLRD